MPHRDAGTLGRMALGAGLVVLGLLFLAAELIDPRIVANAWPLLIVAVGAAFFLGMVAAGEAGGPLAIPACIVTTVGLVLFVQNAFGLWETWAYAWPLVSPGAVGVGLWIFGAWSRNPRLRGIGTWMAFWSLVAFAVLGTFFELVIGLSALSDTVFAELFFPGLLVLCGLFLALHGASTRR